LKDAMIFLFVAGLALLALILVARLFEQLRHVNQRFDNVQARLRRLEEGLPKPAPPTSAGPSVSASPAAPPRVTPSPVLPSSAHTSPPPLPAAAPAPAARPAVVAAAARTRADLETEIGSRWALVIGVLVLVLGVAFFVKYAFDRHWVSETLRVGAGTLAGGAVLAVGVRLAGRGYPLYGRLVAGGGLAILYVSAYAASALYALVPPGVALLWMAMLSGVTAFAADRQNSQGLAATAIVLAFAAPFLVATSQDQHLALFAYDAALVAATLFLVRRHEWLFLALAGFWLTWVTLAAWSSESYRPAYFASTELYLTVVSAMFLVVANDLRGSRHPLAKLVKAALWCGPFLYHCASIAVLFDHSLWLLLYFLVVSAVGIAILSERPWLRLLLWSVIAVPFYAWVTTHSQAAWFVAALAVAFGLYALHLAGQLRVFVASSTFTLPERLLFQANGLALFVWAYEPVYGHAASTARLALGLAIWYGALAAVFRRQAVSAVVPHALGLAFTFTAIAVALGLAGPWTTVAWAAEGAAVVWVGLHTRTTALRCGGAVLLTLAIVRLVVTQFDETLVGFALLLNSRALTGGFIVALLYGAAVIHVRYAPDGSYRWVVGFLAAANVLTIALLTADIYSFWEVRGEQFTASFKREASTSVMWAAYGMALVGLGFSRPSVVLRYLGLGLLGLTVAKLFTIDLVALDGIYRIVGFIVMGLVLLAASFLYHRSLRRSSSVPA
jgi:uncharacterized membrane protein